MAQVHLRRHTAVDLPPSDRGYEGAPVCIGSSPLTNVAVLSRPSLVTLTLSLLADSILAAQGVARFLLTLASRPALLTPTHTAVANPVAAAVHFALLCSGTYIFGV